MDDGVRPGMTTSEAQRVKELEQENRELRRERDLAAGGDFLRGGARPPAAQVVVFIDANKDDVVDAGYPENTDLVIDPATGKLSLKRRRATKPAASELALEEAVKERMPERTLLEIVARTA